MKEIANFFKSPAGQYSILIGIVILALWYLKKAISDALTGEGPEQILDTIAIEQSNLSYPIEQFDIWADGLYEAMNFVGTDYGQIKEVIDQLKTNDDVAALINAYGVRTLYVFGIPAASSNLPQALRRELNWYYSVADANETLSENGISIQF
jgi:hypothetical protein